MGIFDFFKTKEQKARNILERTAGMARSGDLDEMISARHDNIVTNGQISTGVGRFGLDVTNPIPVKGISGTENYFNKLSLQKKISWDRLGSTSTQNINGNIDIYNLTAADGSNLERLYICWYCSETSSKLPEGF